MEHSMKQFKYVWLAAVVVAGSLSIPSSAQDQQPLGDYARKVRQEKTKEQQPSGKKFDNDNLPNDDKLSIVGSPAAAPADDAAAANAPAEKTDEKAADSGAQRQKANDEWKSKIASQKEQIDTLAKDLDLEQREYRLRAASFYADAGERLRNSAAWDKEDAQYKQKIADEQKALDTAKQHLDDMQEDARKAGVPSGMRE